MEAAREGCQLRADEADQAGCQGHSLRAQERDVSVQEGLFEGEVKPENKPLM